MSSKAPLRVALIGPSRFPVGEPYAGGQEAHVHQLRLGLEALGHHVTLFAAPGSDRAEERYPLWFRQRITGTETTEPSGPSAEWMTEYTSHQRLLQALSTELSDRFDIIHNHSLHHLPVAMCSSLPTPMLTTFHTPPILWLRAAVRGGVGAGDVGAGDVVAVSRHTAGEWQRAVGVGVAVVPNGVDLARWDQGPGGTGLIWSGRITPEKGTHLAIEAARRTGRHLRLAGPISDPHYFRTMVAPHLGPDVTHVGHLDHRALAREVGRAAVALATPRWEEPFGLVAAEALACGTPVAAFARGGVREVVGDPSAGRLVPADDIEQLAAAVEVAATLDRAGARRWAEERWSQDRMVLDYVRHYRASIARHTAGRAGVNTSRVGDDSLDETG